MKRAPSIFIGHGSPMNVIEENEFNHNMRELGKSIDFSGIKAILCISAHYQTEGVVINDSKKPRTIHDFYGFPDILYQMHYEAPGSPALAREIKQKLNLDEAKLNHEWGFDHGAWNVLWHLYPEKNVPIIMMSLNYQYSFKEHYWLGEKLKSLRDDGIMILGSGNIVHSFKGIHNSKDAKPSENAVIFNNFVRENIKKRTHENLIQFPANIYEAAKFSVNSAEHYLPLLYVLGASFENEKPQIFNDKIVMSTMSMMSVNFCE